MDLEHKPLYQRQLARGAARSAILDAAARLFSEQGYARTSISDIAAAARVSRPTVSTAVGNKPEVLRDVVEAHIGGIDPAEKVTERPWFLEMLAEPDPRKMLQLHARNIRFIGERIDRLYYATEVAAASDPAVSQIWEELEQARFEAARAVAQELVTKPGIRDGLEVGVVTDVLFAVVSPGVYRSFVVDRGWSPHGFENWAADSTQKLLLNASV